MRAAHGDALALTARELFAGLRSRWSTSPSTSRRGHAGAISAAGVCVELHRVADVLAHGHVRVERVILEHHRDVALAGADIGHVAPVDPDAPRAGRLQPGEDAQRRRLAASRRADQHHELALFDRERKRREHVHRAEGFGDGVELDMGHGRRGP
jgi:hypothetical protein